MRTVIFLLAFVWSSADALAQSHGYVVSGDDPAGATAPAQDDQVPQYDSGPDMADFCASAIVTITLWPFRLARDLWFEVFMPETSELHPYVKPGSTTYEGDDTNVKSENGTKGPKKGKPPHKPEDKDFKPTPVVGPNSGPNEGANPPEADPLDNN